MITPEAGRASLHYDALTGLLNLEGFNARLNYLLEVTPGGFSVLIADIDGLKKQNDTDGHDAGDELLIAAGNGMSKTLRTRDEDVPEEKREEVQFELDAVAAHIHGDEFGIILPGVTEPDDVASIRQRLETDLENDGIKASIDGRAHQVGESIKELVKASDRMMFVRKEARKKAIFDALPRHKRLLAIIGNRCLLYAGANPPRQ